MCSSVVKSYLFLRKWEILWYNRTESIDVCLGIRLHFSFPFIWCRVRWRELNENKRKVSALSPWEVIVWGYNRYPNKIPERMLGAIQTEERLLYPLSMAFTWYTKSFPTSFQKFVSPWKGNVATWSCENYCCDKGQVIILSWDRKERIKEYQNYFSINKFWAFWEKHISG